MTPNKIKVCLPDALIISAQRYPQYIVRVHCGFDSL
jgi:hypothetical protein